MKRTITALCAILLTVSACSKEKSDDASSEAKPDESGTTTSTEVKPSERPTGPGAGTVNVRSGGTDVNINGDRGEVTTGGVKVNKDGVTTGGVKVDKDGVTTGGVKVNKDGTSAGGVKVNKDGTVTVPGVPGY